ncbi:MAG: HAMP domain-containing protein [Deltaproteobacteria bacterium]|nr:HAMP domain-containing protein [Deltaproteobacteria bacterium]TLN02882.1 MAG: HAMP domain-containing protein [bacterium]
MPADRSIAFRLILVITLSGTLIFSAVLGYNYYRSRLVLQNELQHNAENLAMSSVNRVETVLTSVTKVTEGVSRSLESGRYSHEELLTLLRATVRDNAEIFGACAAFEPLSAKARPYGPYYYKQNGQLVYDPEVSFQYLLQDWYQISRELGKTEWTEPYYGDNGASTLMATCSTPFYEISGGTRRLKGIVASDVSLDWLTEMVASIKVLKTGYAFLLSRNGTIVTHPSKEMIMNETIFSLAEARNDQGLRTLGRKMIQGKSDFIPYTDINGRKSWLYYAPIPSVGWTLAVVFPEAELLAQVKKLSLTDAAMGLTGILLLALAVVFIARSITTPLQALAGATAAIARGDFEVELPAVRSNDEVGTLTTAFQVMKSSLKEYISRLTETTAAKERIESELNIAHDIQMGLLPKTFPPFPGRHEFDLFALMEPAKEVGGDFYDFFLVDDRHLCFVIADVSGKGVPAALFMAMSMTLIKATARQGFPPDEILARVNNELSRDNDTCMFVTTFCGVLDTETGELVYANGGHNLPLQVKSGNRVSWLPKSGGLMVGAMEGISYRRERLLLEPGDRLFLYTDGVTEAMNVEEEIFSDQRLERCLSAVQGSGIRESVDGIMAYIRSFSGAAPQSDDITLMMIQYNATRDSRR